MILQRTKSRLAQVIKAIAEGEKRTEVIRQVLAEQITFEPSTTFTRLDFNQDGYITRDEISQFLTLNNVYASKMEIEQIFHYIDYNNDGLISYDDFTKTMLPQEDIGLKQLATLRNSYYLVPHKTLPYEVEFSLTRIFEQEIKNFREVSSLKEILVSSQDFDIYKCFNTIDSEMMGVLDFQSIYDFMRITGFPLNYEEIRAFIRVAGGVDATIINLDQFSAIIQPGTKSINKMKSSLQESRLLNHIYEQQIREDERRRFSQEIEKKNLEIQQKKSQVSLHRSRIIQEIEEQQKYNQYLERSRSLERSRTLEQSKSMERSRVSQLNGSTYNTPLKKLRLNDSLSNSNMKTSPMKGDEEEHLVESIKEYINIDRDIEEIKKQLSLKSDFNLLDAFRVFDTNSRGYITKFEFQNQLNQIGVYPGSNEMYLLFKKIDKDQDGVIKYSEFCSAFLPFTHEYQTLMSNRQPSYIEGAEGIQCFEVDTKLFFKKLLNIMIQGESESESIRQRLAKRPLFSINDAFQTIDVDNNGFIKQDEFQKILNQNGFFASNTDLVSLYDRFDKNKDGKISYGEFIQEMTPKSPQKLY